MKGAYPSATARRADRQGRELIDRVAAGAPVRELFFVKALWHARMPFAGLLPDAPRRDRAAYNRHLVPMVGPRCHRVSSSVRLRVAQALATRCPIETKKRHSLKRGKEGGGARIIGTLGR